MLTKAQLLKNVKAQKEIVESVQTSIGLIGVRMLRWDDIAFIEQAKVKHGMNYDEVADVVLRAACDAKGERIFGDDDIQEVLKLRAPDVKLIAKKAYKLINENPDAEPTLKDEVEKAGKPSSETE